MRRFNKSWPRNDPRSGLFSQSGALEAGFGIALGLVWLTLATSLISALGLGLNLAQKRLELGLLADSAALLASDVSRGLIPGYPCPKAEEFLEEDGVLLTGCRIVGDGVIVRVRSDFLIWPLESWAKAGAP